MTTTPVYSATIKETGIVPEHIFARCPSLVAFTYDRPKVAPPKVGQRPAARKRKK